MSNIEKIKAEIERRIENYWSDGDVDSVVVSGELEELIDFIDSLPEEKPSEDLEEAAIDFADNARKQLYSKDYAISSIADYDHGCIDGFIAGAEWQREQMLKEAVEFECIGKKVKMTVQELINYYIDTECCDVADECGF